MTKKGSSTGGSATSSGTRPRWRRGIAVAVAVALLVAIAGLWLAASLDAAAIERLINRAIGPASNGIYEVRLEDASVSLLAGSVSISGADLRFIPEAVGAAAERGESPGFLFEVRVGQFQLQGVRILPLLMRRAIIARSLEVDSAEIAAILRLGTGDATAAAAADPGPEAAAPGRTDAGATIEQRARAALAGVPAIRVGSIRLRDAGGTVAIYRGSQRERIDRVGGLELGVDGLHIHAEATLEEIARLYSDDVRLDVREIGLAAGTTAQRIELSTGQRFVRMEGFRVEPEATVPEYLARPTIRESDRIAISVGRVALNGLDPSRALARNEVVVEEMEISGFRVEILHDNHKPKAPPRAQKQPHDLVGALPFRLRVDTLRLAEGFVSYAERAPKARRPGTITFEQIEGTITGLDTEVGTSPDETPVPVVVQLSTALMGAGNASLVIRLPLWKAAPTMRVDGRIDAFDATALNGILIPLLGAEVTSGRVNGTAFEISYVPDRATGSLDIYYEDAKLRLTDRDGGGQNLGNRIVSFAANAFAVHDANPSRPGEAPRPGVVDLAFDDTWPFFKLLWVPIREALLEVMKKI